MNRKNITVGAILGVCLLGTLWALGQEVPPRPRPVTPPPEVSDSGNSIAPLVSTAIIKANTSTKASTSLPAVPSVTTLPEPKGELPPWPKVIPTSLPEPKGAPALPVDLTPPAAVEPKTPTEIQQVQAVQPPPATPPVVQPVAPPMPAPLPPMSTPIVIEAPLPPTTPVTPPQPLPAPMPPKLEPEIVSPPPAIVTPPVVTPPVVPQVVTPPVVTPPPVIETPTPPVPEPKVSTPLPVSPPVAPPVSPPSVDAKTTPWNPADSAKPQFPPVPQIVESPPVDPNVSRFVVQKQTQPKNPPPVFNPPIEPQISPPVASPPVPQAVPNAMPPIGPATPVPQDDNRYFTMIKRWRQPQTTPTPMQAPKQPVNFPRPDSNRPPDTNSHLHAPAVEPSAGGHTPQISVEKRGPFFIKAAGPMKYQITLKNVGVLTAQNVRVEDEIPGAQVVATTPIADQQLAERLIWMIPTMRPGEERVLQEELQPARPGDVVSTTSVHVYTSTSFRTRVEGDATLSTPNGATNGTPSEKSIASTPVVRTPVIQTPGPVLKDNPTGPNLGPTPTPDVDSSGPSLDIVPPSGDGLAKPGPLPFNQPVDAPKSMPMTVEVKALPVVSVGQKLEFEVIVTNKSLLPLTGMMLYGKIPTGLTHPQGESIGADLPNLAAGDTKSYKMPVGAAAPGKYTVEIRVTAAPNFELVARPVVTVEETGLTITQTIAGGRLLMGKDNDIKITVTNNQPTPATQVQIVDALPDGLDYVNCSDRGLYQANNRTLTWLIESLPPGGTRNITLRVQPKVAGSITHDVVARMGNNPEVRSSAAFTVDAFSTLQVQVQARDSVLEEGKETVFAVKVTNTGASVATNIHVGLTPTDGLQFGGFAQAPTAYRMNGKEILFAPIPRLAPGGTATIHLGLKGIVSGDQRVRVQVASDQMRTILVREELTRVYKDR